MEDIRDTPPTVCLILCVQSLDHRFLNFVFLLLMSCFFLWSCFILVQMDDLEIQQHYDEFFEEVYVEMEKVGTLYSHLLICNAKPNPTKLYFML